MFVVAMKTTRPRIVAYGIALCLLVAVTFGLAGQQQSVGAQATVGGDDAHRVAYLRQLGYEVDEAWIRVQEIQLPVEFDETLSAYNELQQKAGDDLSPYRGRRVKCWTYTVRNYPVADGVQANLYEYNNRIIGGDISSVTAEGFSHGLLPLAEVSPSQGEENGTTGQIAVLPEHTDPQ